jgi:alanine racemase
MTKERRVPVEGWRRPAWAEVDLSALARNTATLAAVVASSALCAVVKADGYGHGARTIAPTLLGAGATSLGVALVDEGIELRDDGIDAPILMLSEAPSTALRDAIDARLTLAVGSVHGARSLCDVARDLRPEPVHVKVDTGMHRQGVEPTALDEVLDVLERGGVRVGGLWTHFPVADGSSAEELEFTASQLDRFVGVVEKVAPRLGGDVVVHAANTAGALGLPESRLDLVRVGLGLYGYLPTPMLAQVLADAGLPRLEPVLSLKARVVAVRDLPAGERPSYGRRRPLRTDARVATVPLGYADGVPRALLDAGQEVLIRGSRRELAGVVTMDQLLVDCGDDPVEVGDEVVLLGSQGDESITADEWASALSTISWEVLCGIKQRVPKLATT